MTYREDFLTQIERVIARYVTDGEGKVKKPNSMDQLDRGIETFNRKNFKNLS